MGIFSLIRDALRDRRFRAMSPERVQTMVPPGDFAFIVHPATMKEVYLKYPFARRFPRIAEWFLEHFWPIRCSRVTGNVGDREINGFIITIPLTGAQMRKNPGLAERMVVDAALLSQKLGCRVVGLGGLTTWATHDGVSVARQVSNIRVTTGHAATVGWMMEIIHELIIHQEGERRFEDLTVAVIGAGGLMGWPLSRFIAEGIKHRGRPVRPQELILVDVPQKMKLLEELAKELTSLCRVSAEAGDGVLERVLPRADMVVVVTNADKVLFRDPKLFKQGALIIDDTYPNNADGRLARDRTDCSFVKVAVNAPRVEQNFPMPLPKKTIHTCLAGAMTTAYVSEVADLSDVGSVSTELAQKIVAAGKRLGFVVGGFHGIDERPVKLGQISARYRRVLEEG